MSARTESTVLESSEGGGGANDVIMLSAEATDSIINNNEESGFVLKHCDMTEDMLRTAVAVSAAALQKQLQSSEMADKDVAMAIKKYFDKHFKPTWHCIVGK
jgi:hypothetical protein